MPTKAFTKDKTADAKTFSPSYSLEDMRANMQRAAKLADLAATRDNLAVGGQCQKWGISFNYGKRMIATHKRFKDTWETWAKLGVSWSNLNILAQELFPDDVLARTLTALQAGEIKPGEKHLKAFLYPEGSTFSRDAFWKAHGTPVVGNAAWWSNPALHVSMSAADFAPASPPSNGNGHAAQNGTNGFGLPDELLALFREWKESAPDFFQWLRDQKRAQQLNNAQVLVRHLQSIKSRAASVKETALVLAGDIDALTGELDATIEVLLQEEAPNGAETPVAEAAPDNA